ncbi:MAG: type II toxin-antitoxin system RelE/ParE family toxin [Thermoproteales archaeon]|nr:type II toxin-antitoxin system RelE/ParE family toxin [Thermoproteales archaeon]
MADAYRVRVGDYRILYRVYWKERMVVVFRIALRRRAYRAL